MPAIKVDVCVAFVPIRIVLPSPATPQEEGKVARLETPDALSALPASTHSALSKAVYVNSRESVKYYR